MSDQIPQLKKWYQKKRYIIPAILLGFLIFLGANSQSQNNSASVIQPIKVNQNINSPSLNNTNTTPQPTHQNSYQNTGSVPLSNNNYYQNSIGNTVHSPAYAPSVPAGATAKCRDGTYSFSQSRRGTCSHHGGVTIWY